MSSPPAAVSATTPGLERRTIRKVVRRLIPFLIVCYFAAYLDRVNVGFAALTMNRDLGLTASMYGFGAGAFFLTYFFFEVPSNLFLDRFGARKWIARIMFSWGVISGLMAFIPRIADGLGMRNEHVFYGLRMLLGIAEAGFYPGIIFYLTLWFPTAYRARVIGYFMTAIPISSVIGAPFSGLLLDMNGWAGLAGWQWMFLIEAAPSILLSFAVFFYLTDRPRDATWLAAEERNWLVQEIANEDQRRRQFGHFTVLQAILNPRLLAFAIVWFGITGANYGIGFWLPQIVKGFGLTNSMTGFVTMIPYFFATIAMAWFGHHSDVTRERKSHAVIALLAASGGVFLSSQFDQPVVKMVLLTVATCGVYAAIAVFWTLPTALLAGVSAAAGIAAINSVGNLAGFAGPYAMGWVRDATGNYSGGLLLIAGLLGLSMILVLVLGHDARAEHPADAANPTGPR